MAKHIIITDLTGRLTTKKVWEMLEKHTRRTDKYRVYKLQNITLKKVKGYDVMFRIHDNDL